MNCYFCDKTALATHGIHGCDDFRLCFECRRKFIVLRYMADPKQGSVLGFTCRNCGFTCDVPGIIEFNNDTREFELKVDTMHNFCQSCGHPRKGGTEVVPSTA